MPKIYVSYTIETADEVAQEILVAMLQDYGFDGFEQTATQLIANGYKELLNEVEIDEYLKTGGWLYQKEALLEENWNQKWESSFEPIVIDQFCAVRADFHAPITSVDFEIIITPKMSFGTGHHATTWMMMKAMQQLNFLDKTVLDFGTGTGILAILAEKMGARSIVGVDYDSWCIENGTENMGQNNCQHIKLVQADNLVGQNSADIILANINKNVILSNFVELSKLLNPNGVLLISGILEADESDINLAAAQVGLRQLQKEQKLGWLCIKFALVA